MCLARIYGNPDSGFYSIAEWRAQRDALLKAMRSAGAARCDADYAKAAQCLGHLYGAPWITGWNLAPGLANKRRAAYLLFWRKRRARRRQEMWSIGCRIVLMKTCGRPGTRMHATCVYGSPKLPRNSKSPLRSRGFFHNKTAASGNGRARYTISAILDPTPISVRIYSGDMLSRSILRRMLDMFTRRMRLFSASA